MRKVVVTVEFDLDQLQGYTDEYLAHLWHVCQANPAEYGDRGACGMAEAVKFEIVRRWLQSAPVGLYNHQMRSTNLREAQEARDERRRAEAVALVDGASDMDPADMALLGWSLTLPAISVDREAALARVVDVLGSVELAAQVTKTSLGFFVWAKPR